MESENEQNQRPSNYDLCRQADELLRQAGTDIWGEERTQDNFRQAQFEQRMQTGAYCPQIDKKK